MRTKLGIHNKDARDIDTVLPADTVDVTVTSPPYFDLKNYGHPDQIGFGQTYEEYLDELEAVFKKVYTATKKTGTLWVIIDMFKRDGEVIPLPFDFVARMKRIKWKLQEVIVWEKDRTVPWAHNGQMRNSFEYVLVFSKTNEYKFRLERAKSVDSLKEWWIRYPERYHPKGKSPGAIWHFPIPTQGSWGKGYIRHFCPLPEDLIAQILQISTDEKDLVLDPFAGSGAVLSRAANMNRRYVGFELNPDYIRMFEDYVRSTGAEKAAAYKRAKKYSRDQNKFADLIWNLRFLKFARVLLKQVPKQKRDCMYRVFVSSEKTESAEKHKTFELSYHILIKEGAKSAVEDAVTDAVTQAPLSKFGIQPKFVFHTNLATFLKVIGTRKVYVYSTRNTHSFKKALAPSDLTRARAEEMILSDIMVSVDEGNPNSYASPKKESKDAESSRQ